MLSSKLTSSFALLCLSTLSSATPLVSRQDAAPTAQVLNGTYTGAYQSNYDQDLFLGIPYAQPPIGNLRFRQAQSINASWTGSHDATEYSADCIGYGSDEWANLRNFSEDCLTLNVIRPAGVKAGDKLPIGLWIYGGGSFEGGTHDPRYNLSFIVQQSSYARSPFIAVSINYRLSAWGYIFGQEVLSSGNSNLGLRDQRLALHWVQENIAAFGGDPEKVTIWGESAGASSVSNHIIAYGGRDDKLFRGAIMESGAPSGSYQIASAWQPVYNNITAAANCSSANDTLQCLREVPVNTLSAIFNSSVTAQAKWGGQVDNDIIRGSGTDQIRNGEFVRVPILNGRNRDEGTMFATKGINTTDEFLALLSKTYDNASVTALAALYPDIPAIGIPPTFVGRPTNASGLGYLGQQWKRAAAFAGDVSQHAPRRLVSQTWAKYGIPNYSYHFKILPAGIPAWRGVSHFLEVAFVFHDTIGDGYINAVSTDPFAGVPDSVINAATLISRMWVSFIVDLDPNNSGVSCVSWPSYTTDAPKNIVFDANVTELAYVEDDYYRANGIAYIMDLL